MYNHYLKILMAYRSLAFLPRTISQLFFFSSPVNRHTDKPHFNGPANEQISLTVGDPLHLNCSARGNPRPWVTWTLPSAATFEGDVFSVDSVTTEHRGLYICSMSNKLGITTVEFNVDVQGELMTYT